MHVGHKQLITKQFRSTVRDLNIHGGSATELLWLPLISLFLILSSPLAKVLLLTWLGLTHSSICCYYQTGTLGPTHCCSFDYSYTATASLVHYFATSLPPDFSLPLLSLCWSPGLLSWAAYELIARSRSPHFKNVFFDEHSRSLIESRLFEQLNVQRRRTDGI